MFFPERGGMMHVLGYLAWAGFMLVAFLITAVVLVLLIRFLWFGTKAARLYIASHTPAAAAPVSAATTPGPFTYPTPPPKPDRAEPASPEPAPADIPGPVTPDASGPVAPAAPPKAPTKPRKPKSPPVTPGD